MNTHNNKNCITTFFNLLLSDQSIIGKNKKNKCIPIFCTFFAHFDTSTMVPVEALFILPVALYHKPVIVLIMSRAIYR